MAVPILGSAGTTHTIQAAGATIDPVQSLGGAYLDGGSTSASPAITTRLAPGKATGDGMKGPIENAASTGAFHTKKATPHLGNAFAYNAAGKYVMINGGSSQGTIGGVANTVMDSSSAPTGGRRSIHFKVAQYGAKTLTAHRAGNWQAIGVAGQRHNWHDGSSAAYPSALTESYPTLGATSLGFSATVDSAARPSKGVPGHLTNLEDFTNWSHSTAAVHGGAKSPNYIQYEAKTT